jgi:hypothetical protein
MDVSKTKKGTGAWVYGYGTRKKLSFSLGKYITILQAEMYAIKACTVDNLDRGYRNMYTVCPGSVTNVFIKNTRRELFSKCHSFYSN